MYVTICFQKKIQKRNNKYVITVLKEISTRNVEKDKTVETTTTAGANRADLNIL